MLVPVVMGRKSLFFITVFLFVLLMEGSDRAVVVDSVTRQPLPSASVFDKNGNVAGITDSKGRLPYLHPESFPLSLRYLGFKEKSVTSADIDTIFMVETSTELPEVSVESGKIQLLHLVAYVREYSTLSTYSDTVFMFREKMIDFMLPPDKKMRFKGWSNPRIIKSKSYYRFTDADGLDSVSRQCNYHFSWSDWVGVVPSPALPSRLRYIETGADTLRGKYSAKEIWHRKDDRIAVDINVLADTASRKWVSSLDPFFRKDMDFERYRHRYIYENVVGDSIYPVDLKSYSFNIESNGRGRGMFRFNRNDAPFYVSTFAEVHILDKEYLSVKEAKKWSSNDYASGRVLFERSDKAAGLQEPILKLIARVEAIDSVGERLRTAPDYMLRGKGSHKQNAGERVLSLLKQATGITYLKSHKNFDRKWQQFREERKRKNVGMESQNNN